MNGEPSISLHAALLAAGFECNNQMGNSDLFVVDTPEARAIIAQYPLHHKNMTTFLDQVNKKPSIEVPFAFEKNLLRSLRARWEKGTTTYVEMEVDETVYVVCSGGNRTLYECFRYFKIGGEWQVSNDLVGANLPAVWAWITRISPITSK